jgi:hypothetical protein
MIISATAVFFFRPAKEEAVDITAVEIKKEEGTHGNIKDFFSTYPCSYTDDNFMTRWANYANTPLEKWLTDQIYPGMREKLSGLKPLEAVQQLDWWVQGKTDIDRKNPNQGCFLYAYDESIWGYDRNFFGEESIFYPYNDCEDRSILLSHLVRDLVGLDCVLVYYPGHLAMAVNFPYDVPGDYITVARKAKGTGNWFVGGKCDENGHQTNLKLDFLDEGVLYACTIYADAKNAHWQGNAKAYTITKKTVKKGDVLKLREAPGGGFAISLIKR